MREVLDCFRLVVELEVLNQLDSGGGGVGCF